MTLGVDVGGTFTDIVWWDGDALRSAKTSSTPDQSVGVIEGSLELLGGARASALLHGTTVATNALLERRGARMALVTTQGFEDVIEIARQDRPSLYDSMVDRPRPLVDRSARVGLRRVDGQEQWSDQELADLAARISQIAPDAVAVSILYGYELAPHEAAVRDALPPDLPVSLSSTTVPEFREYERTTTTVVNAFLAPEVGAYLSRLEAGVRGVRLPQDIMVMRSSGGLIPISRAATLPSSILLSGPAGGVVAAAALGDTLGAGRLISFDMGGTSTDVARIEGGVPEVSFERSVEGLPIRMPSVAIHTVGAGGGSIGWIDPGDALRVGPRSAGAQPGPASYGRGGTDPTVTDANLTLGRIGSTSRLGGTLSLDSEAADSALRRLGDRVGLSAREAAEGMIEVVEAHMERAIRKVSVEEGADPRGARLVAFGGAGGLHATALARRLDMSGVIVPAFAGVFSAFGLLLSPPRVDLARSMRIDASTAGQLGDRLGELERNGLDQFNHDIGGSPRAVRRTADVRYVGQAHETSVAIEPGLAWATLAERFHVAHRTRNGFARPEDPIEVVTLRVALIGAPALGIDDIPAPAPRGDARRPSRPVVVDLGATAVPTVDVWWRPALRPGQEVIGPAVIEEPEATTFIGSGERATVHDSGALEISW